MKHLNVFIKLQSLVTVWLFILTTDDGNKVVNISICLEQISHFYAFKDGNFVRLLVWFDLMFLSTSSPMYSYTLRKRFLFLLFYITHFSLLSYPYVFSLFLRLLVLNVQFRTTLVSLCFFQRFLHDYMYLLVRTIYRHV